MAAAMIDATDLDRRLARLDAVGLERLDEVAALRTRVDRKYLVPVEAAHDLVTAFAHRSVALEVGGLRSFLYDSLYFDTPDLESYRAAAHGRRRRFKVRTRVYRDAGTGWIEVKTRGTRGETVKVRLDHAVADRYELTPESAAFVDEAVGRDGLAATLRPVLGTRYRRRTLLDEGANSRVTIDTELELAGFDGGVHDVPSLAVIETKGPGAVLDQDRWLWAHGMRPVAISKYAVGMALVHPSLPANRWHRALRQLGSA